MTVSGISTVKLEEAGEVLNQYFINLHQSGVPDEEEELEFFSTVKCIQISDVNQGLTLDMWVPASILPDGIKLGDVLRVKSVISANNLAYENVLVPTDHSNYMVVDKSFK